MDARTHSNPLLELHKEATQLIKTLVVEDSHMAREFLGNTLATVFNTMTGNLQTNYQVIERAKQEWESSLDAVSDPLFIHDREFKVMRCNLAYAQAAGLPFREIIGRPYYEMFPKMDGPTDGCRKASERQVDGEEEIAVPGVDRVFNAKFHLVRDSDGAYLYSLHVLQDITAKKKAEEALRESEEKFRSISDGALDAVLMLDDAGRIVYWNLAASRIFGYSAEEALGRDVHTFLAPRRYHDASREGWGAFHESGQGPVIGKVLELFALRKGGTEFPIELSVSALKFKGRWHAVGILRDVTTRKQAEENLRNSEASLARAQRIAHLGNWDWDIATGELFWSDEVYRLFNLVPGQSGVTYETFLNFIHPKDREFVAQSINAALVEQKSYSIDHRIVLSDASERIVHEEAEVIRDRAGKPIRMSGTVHDITERKRMENELRESEARYRHITEGLTDYQYTVRIENGRSVETTQSPACVKVTGYMAEEYVANPHLWIQMVVPEDRELVMNHVQQILAGEDVLPIEHRITRKNGEIRWISDTTILFRDASGKLLSYDGVIKDITERKKAEKEFHELFLASIESLASAIEAKSPWTRGHSERVADYAAGIGQALGLTNGELEKLRIAALLHDIGKIGTYDGLLEKPGKLSDTEYESIKQHPGKGAEMLAPIKQMRDIIPWIRGHHERFDGAGYPDGLRGEDIPLQARILAVADTFDSMTAERPYRTTPGKSQALEEIQRHAGTQFDPVVVEAFLRTEPLAALSHGENIVTG